MYMYCPDLLGHSPNGRARHAARGRTLGSASRRPLPPATYRERTCFPQPSDCAPRTRQACKSAPCFRAQASAVKHSREARLAALHTKDVSSGNWLAMLDVPVQWMKRRAWSCIRKGPTLREIDIRAIGGLGAKSSSTQAAVGCSWTTTRGRDFCGLVNTSRYANPRPPRTKCVRAWPA